MRDREVNGFLQDILRLGYWWLLSFPLRPRIGAPATSLLIARSINLASFPFRREEIVNSRDGRFFLLQGVNKSREKQGSIVSIVKEK